jgi:hypothetical protein
MYRRSPSQPYVRLFGWLGKPLTRISGPTHKLHRHDVKLAELMPLILAFLLLVALLLLQVSQ